MVDQDRFIAALTCAKEKVFFSQIGTMGEKSLHRTLKYYFEPNEEFHEVEYLGAVADIKNEDGIIEIQTRSLTRLVPKLEKFLSQDKVNVVFPIKENKTIHIVDTETEECTSFRKSPKKGSVSDALPEIAEISRFIPHENLTVTLVFVNVTETRMLAAKKKVGRKTTAKIDCIPTSINKLIELRTKEDFLILLPQELPEKFTSAEFAKASKLKAIKLHNSLKFLMNVGILTREKGKGRAYIYSFTSNKKETI